MSIRQRLTARVLLFDTDHRILLMKGRLISQPDRPGEWFTIGGGVEPGETLAQAARREILEESGIGDAALGPVVWRRDLRLHDSEGRPVIFEEHYLVARCASAEPSRLGWNAVERELIEDIRWWSLVELQTTAEPIHPPGLAERLGDLIAGRYPAQPLMLPAG
jgi:8-oxo-dGTP pyrophosphatase MutT (NUDIX family)